MNIFAYGTLLFPEVINALTERQFEFEDLTIHDFERRGLAGKIYPGMIEAQGTSVAGRLWFNVDETSLRIIDLFEGPAYERRTVTLNSTRYGTVSAFTYVIPKQRANTLTVETWEPEQFRELHLAHYVSMCRTFREDTLKDLD